MSADTRRYVAVDLGAESGRVLLGTLANGRVALEELHRFANKPLRLPSGLHWDVAAIEREVRAGLAAAARAADGPIASVGVDAWGCDYALLDANGALLGDPFHYRDDRTEGIVERVLAQVPRDELYATTGLQLLPFNTLFQLVAQREGSQLGAAATLLTIPDLIAHRLGGRIAVERTAASTTQLLDVRDGEWALPLVERLGLPARMLPPLVDAGAPLGRLDPAVAAAAGLDPAPELVAVAAHDTASAVAAVPARADEHVAFLSSGTWSLLGMELDAPVLSADAQRYDLTNERGVDGTIRLLRNVMGLWLVQECRRAWERAGEQYSYEQLGRMAADAPAGGPLIDPDAPELLPPGDMPARIAARCAAAGQHPPDGVAATVRCVLESLACKYRLVLERIEHATGRRAARVHVVGGGARNATLCQLTADVLRRPVHAGPVEATALGNVLVQARADGRLGSLAELRACVAASTAIERYEPAAASAPFEALYDRFLAVTGLAPVPAHVTP